MARANPGRTRIPSTQEHLRDAALRRQAARKWHNHISAWMENNGYAAVNSEKTIFMKCKGSDYIIHGLFVDDTMHIYTSDEMEDEF